MAYPLEDHFSGGPSRTSGSMDFSPEQTTSRAVSAAMRALQERIRFLERENDQLVGNVRLLQDQFTQDAASWKARHSDLLQSAGENEKLLRAHTRDLEDELRACKSALQNSIEQAKILEGQTRVSQSEAHRCVEQYKLDKETWRLDKERLEKQLQDKAANEKQLLQRVADVENRERAMAEELTGVREVKREMEGEVTYLRSNKAKETKQLQRSLAQVEAELKGQIADLQKQIKALEVKNNKLTELANRRKEEADFIKKEMQGLRNSVSPGKRSPMRGSHSRKSSAKPPLTERARRPENRHIGAHLSPEGVDGDEAELNYRISRVEAELEEDNWKYKDLLTQSQDSNADLSSIRTQMDSLAMRMDNKNSLLLSLKKQHNDLARSRMSLTK